MRGEKMRKQKSATDGTGSPPRARGKVRKICTSRTKIEDHPRVRGEKFRSNVEFFEGVGSPPRARGKVKHIVDAMYSDGITPACAGKSRISIYFSVGS